MRAAVTGPGWGESWISTAVRRPVAGSVSSTSARQPAPATSGTARRPQARAVRIAWTVSHSWAPPSAAANGHGGPDPPDLKPFKVAAQPRPQPPRASTAVKVGKMLCTPRPAPPHRAASPAGHAQASLRAQVLYLRPGPIRYGVGEQQL